MGSSRLVCLLVTVLVFGEGCVGDDDVAFPPETKIVGGGEVDIKDFPYQVYLDMNKTFCGGVIISDRWVLTAAHCTVGLDPCMMSIRVGSSDKTSGGFRYGVEQVVNHPLYERSFNYDISAVRISKDINLDRSMGVDKVLLPEFGAASPSEGTEVSVIGWGRVGPNVTDNYPTKLKGAVNSVVNFSHCALGCRPRDGNLTLCLKGETGSLCFGDSGGPVTRDNVLLGINSAVTSKKCVSSFSLITSVFAFRQWINETTGV